MLLKKMFFIPVILILLSNITYSHAAAVPNKGISKKKVLDSLLTTTGFKEQLEVGLKMGAEFFEKGGILPGMERADDKEVKRFVKVLSEEMSFEFVYGSILNRLQEEYNSEYVEKIIDYYKKPYVLRITEKEVNASKKQPGEVIYEINQKEYNNDLLEVIKDFNRKNNLKKLEEIYIKKIIKEVISVFQDEYPGKLRIPEEALAEQVYRSMALLRATTDNTSLMTAYYSYMDIPGDELKKYFDYYLTDHGKWKTRIIYSALYDSLCACIIKGVRKTIKMDKADKKQKQAD